jgi:transposase
MTWRQVTDKQWRAIEPYLPKRRLSRKGGRPAADNRRCFEGI